MWSKHCVGIFTNRDHCMHVYFWHSYLYLFLWMNPFINYFNANINCYSAIQLDSYFHSFKGHLSLIFLVIFSPSGQKYFYLKKTYSLVIHIMQVNVCHCFQSQKTYIGSTGWVPVAPDGISGSCGERRSVCARNWTGEHWNTILLDSWIQWIGSFH